MRGMTRRFPPRPAMREPHRAATGTQTWRDQTWTPTLHRDQTWTPTLRKKHPTSRPDDLADAQASIDPDTGPMPYPANRGSRTQVLDTHGVRRGCSRPRPALLLEAVDEFRARFLDSAA